jgi:hypothetical protein
MRLKQQRYFKPFEGGENVKIVEEVTNGFILSPYNLKTGQSDFYAQRTFVSPEDLETDFEEIEFKIEVDLKEERIKKLTTFLNKLAYELDQYGTLENYQDWMNIEGECKLLNTLFTMEFKSKGEFEQYVNRAIKETFPEDFADEVIWGEATTFYFIVYDLLDPIKRVFIE